MMNKPEIKTSLAKSAAKWVPAIHPHDRSAVDRLTDEKVKALGCIPVGIQDMIRKTNALLDGEDHLGRRRTLTEARTGLMAIAEGKDPPSWFPIWDVFCYWEAAAEIALQRGPAPEAEPLTMEDRLERLRKIVEKPLPSLRQ